MKKKRRSTRSSLLSCACLLSSLDANVNRCVECEEDEGDMSESVLCSSSEVVETRREVWVTVVVAVLVWVVVDVRAADVRRKY